jgi:hypothetical protein
MDVVVMSIHRRAPEWLGAPGACVHPGADGMPRVAVATLRAR